MKKYIKPSIKTVNIESNAILSGSGVGVDANSTITGPQRVRGCGRNLDWDDDDEE